MIKSGTDFERLSKITLKLDDGKMNVSVEEILVDEKYEQDEKVAQIVEQFKGKSITTHFLVLYF